MKSKAEQDQEWAIRLGLIQLVDRAHGDAVEAGWWDGESHRDTVPAKLMLIVSEVAEAMEGHRKGLMDDHLPNRPMMEVELADAIIRIADLAGKEGLDISGSVLEKMDYNKTRADHKPENRAKDHGKAY